LAREDGHRLYFTAAFWGAILFSIILAIHVFLTGHWKLYESFISDIRPLLTPWFKDLQKGGNPVDLTVVAVETMVLAYPFATVFNGLLFKFEKYSISKAIGHDDMERILHKAAGE